MHLWFHEIFVNHSDIKVILFLKRYLVKTQALLIIDEFKMNLPELSRARNPWPSPPTHYFAYVIFEWSLMQL